MKETCACELQEDLEKIFSGYEGLRRDIIPLLQDIQTCFNHLPAEALRKTAAFLKIPECTVYGVATFYTQFHLVPQGKHKIRICQGTACHVRGAKKITEAVQNKIGIGPGETTEDGEFSVERVACIGSCALAPAVIGADKIHGPMTPEKMVDLIETIQENG